MPSLQKRFLEEVLTNDISPRIVNPIFFIRGLEPREPIDLVEPVAKAIELTSKLNLPTTFLVQYDALIDSNFTDLLNNLDSRYEVGLWLEMVQPLIEKAEIKWRGRWAWDWQSQVSMMVGYSPAEREKIIDVFIEDFRQIFGYYPKSVGSWVLDSHTLGYLADKYDITAACNCKDQCGTDGYTLWGGYWNQGYYPSRANAIVPAQDESHQIPVPVFRMLGSDPIYQYDYSLGEERQGVVTLEPVYSGGGGCKEWVDWFIDVNFKSPCLAFGYAQVGQENSFGWPSMQKGIIYQLEELAKLRDEGVVRIEKLVDSGEWFKSKFDLTPTTAVTALSDWQSEGRKSVWYDSRYYRTNLFWEDGKLRIRDIHLFDQRYPERYLNDTCKSEACTYDALPVMDGYNWSTKDQLAGIRLVKLVNGKYNPIAGSDPRVSESSDTDLHISWPLVDCGNFEILCKPDCLEIENKGCDWALEMSWSADKSIDLVDVTADSLAYRHEGFDYIVRCSSGHFERRQGESVLMLPEDGRIVLNFGE